MQETYPTFFTCNYIGSQKKKSRLTVCHLGKCQKNVFLTFDVWLFHNLSSFFIEWNVKAKKKSSAAYFGCNVKDNWEFSRTEESKAITVAAPPQSVRIFDNVRTSLNSWKLTKAKLIRFIFSLSYTSEVSIGFWKISDNSRASGTPI